MTRRGYLAALGGGLAATAGCLSRQSGGSTPSPTGEPAAEASWPQLGKTASHGGANPSVTGFGKRPSKAWSLELDGPVTTPTVVGDTVYVTRGVPGDDGPVATLEAYALGDGSRAWATPLMVDGSPVTFHFSAPNSNLRPIYYRGRLHVSLGDRVVAVDTTSGNQAWVSKQYDSVSFTDPPTVGTRGVYAGGHEALVALDHEGSERWAWPALPTESDEMGDPTTGPGSVRIAAVGEDQIAVAAGTVVAALEPADGTAIWETDTERPRSGTAVVADGTLVRAGFEGVEARGTDGDRLWRSPWPGRATIRPAVSAGTVFVAGLEGTVAAYALDSGEKTWERSLPFAEWAQGTVPVVSDGVLHLVRVSYEARTARIHAMDPATGESLWRLEADATRARGPVPASGRLVFTTERTPESQRETSTVSAGQDTTTTVWAYEPAG